MNILSLGMHSTPSSGGVDRYFSGLLDGLLSSGANVTAAAFGPPDSARSLHSLGDAGLPLRRRLSAIRRFCVPTGFSLFASHFALYAFPLLLRLRGRPHVVHFHGPWAVESAHEKEPPWTIAAKYLVERAVYSSASKLIVLSEAFQDILVNRYGVNPDRISIIPGGIDLVKFRPTERDAARRILGWPQDARIAFSVRRLVPRMGLESLIDAVASIPSLTLVIGGTGPLEQTLRRQCAALGLAHRVIFTGFIPDDLLPAAYSAADFSVVPSEALEGFGLVALESLACGRPVLVTPVGGLPEIVTPLDPALVMHRSISESLHLAATRPDLLPSGEKCRAHASGFSWSTISRRVLSLYEEVCHA